MHVLRRKADRCLAQTLLVCLCGLLFSISVCGLDRDRTITQFYHTAWTAKDGAPSQITALTQTQDGYLWIGSGLGLFRFDGVQFEPYQPPPGTTLPSHNINSLMATSDGGLWISFNPSGLAFLKDGAISIFRLPENLPVSEVVCFAEDFDGRVWAGAHSGLAVFDGSRWVNTASDWHFANRRIWAMFVDREGTLWIAADNTIVFLQRGSRKFQETGLRIDGVAQIGQAKDGRLWMTDWFRPIRPIPLAGRDLVLEDPKIQINAYKFLFDREGSLWLTAGGADGIRRLQFPERVGKRKLESNDPELESFTAHDGLTDNSVNTFFEDREGNIWVSSNKGLDRFRHSYLVPVILPPGHRDLTLLAGHGGEIWVASASSKPMLRIRGENIVTRNVPMEVSSVCQDSNGVVWWGAHGGMWRQQNELFDYFPEPKNASLDWFWEVIPSDSHGGLWVGVGDVGMFHFKDRTWTTPRKPAGLLDRVPSASYRDPTGRIWFGYTENRVYTLEGEHVQAYSHDDGIDVGRIRVIRGRGPLFWFGGELGLAVFSGGRFKTIRTSGGEPFGTVSGIVETPDGALWLNNLHGVIRISPEEVRQVAENPDHAVTYQTFDFLDGLPGAPQMTFRSSTAIEATDGRLWFATDNGLVWIDPTHLSKNMVPPPVSIRSLETEGKKYGPSAALQLPAGTHAFRIEYAGLSLSMPERVRFRYQLEGADKDWQDVGTRRQAFYTNLGPGKYTFRVIASNNDGIWNDQGATLVFSIEPAWYQTNWFRVLCVFAGLLVGWTLYRLRVRHVASEISHRFDERLEERTRLARDLHDTFLQTIQGSKMVADDALEAPSDPIRMRLAVEQLSHWLGQATDEGRAVLNSLRTSTIERNDLAEALRRATKDELFSGSIAVTFSVVGEPRQMHPIIRDEIYRIGYEAIRNAHTHSQASRLEVELRYMHDLYLRVSDNGVGIDPDVSEKGKEGHFGLQGMRERADRIGGRIAIVSAKTSGTEITIVVPGRIVFRETSQTILNKLRSLLGGNAKHPLN
jgi:signal transduction histidine kinase/ligand-binding sensor domain-containing protein